MTALFVAMYLLKIRLFLVCSVRTSVSSRTVLLGGICENCPGFTGATKGWSEKVSYVTGEIVRYKSHNFPFPKLEWTEEAFECSPT